jgi:exonuclease SbcD
MPIIMVAGNHDFPRAADTGCLLPLFQQLGVTVVDRAAQKIVFPELSLNVLAVPDTPGMVRPAFTPDPECRFNIVVMHGEVEGMSGLRHERALQSYRQGDVPAGWDYIALGHYHVHQQLAPNMYYSGSIDYTSTNPWGELADEKKFGVSGKGFVERNLVTGEHTFHALPKTAITSILRSTRRAWRPRRSTPPSTSCSTTPGRIWRSRAS